MPHRTDRIILWPVVVLFLALLAPFATASSGEPAAPDGGGGVVLELFTSQGCSSCPPADRLLARLAEEPELAGRLIPLAFHVDYWNSLGWRDPFSSERWSERQTSYARVLPERRVYTPQAVVQGAWSGIGSRERDVRAAIAEALAAPAAGRVVVEVGAVDGGVLPVVVTAQLQSPVARELHLEVALFEGGLRTEVPRGENSGRTLRNEGVVRWLETVLTLGPQPGEPRSKSLSIRLEDGWKPESLGVAAFLQDPRTLAIHGAAAGRPGGR